MAIELLTNKTDYKSAEVYVKKKLRNEKKLLKYITKFVLIINSYF